MSPEQASGEDTDRQTDVWAFGCVLYEMLSSRRLFDGRNSAEILASVLKSTPDLDRLPAETPLSIRRLLRRCLQRDRNERLRDIGDARLEITDVLVVPPSNEQSAVRQVRSWERPAWILTALITWFAGAGVVWVFRPATQPAERRLELSLPPTGLFSQFAISPDGAKVAFIANNDGSQQLWIRSLDAESSAPLPGTEFAWSPFWSPDSQSVAFFSENQLKVTNIAGGAPRVLGAAAGRGGAWSKDGTILFTKGPLYSIRASGGEGTAVTHLEGTQPVHLSPTFLPDGKRFLYYAPAGDGPSAVYVGELGSPLQRRLLDSDTQAVYVPGYVLFGRNGTLLAQGFDAGSLTLRGDPFPLVERIDGQFGDGQFGFLGVSASNDGTIVYRRAGILQRQFSWIDRQGNELQKVGAPVSGNAGTLSVNGHRVAFNHIEGGNSDVWLLDVEQGTVDPFTSNPAVDAYPLFSHDGRYIAFSSNRKAAAGDTDLYRSSVGAPADAELLIPGAVATDWSRDGRNMLIMRDYPQSIWALPFDEKGFLGSPRPVVKTGAGDAVAQFSPDSKWIVYQSKKTGQWEIYVQSFPDSQIQATRISDAGGTQARWSDDGTEIFYVTRNDRLAVVPVQVSLKSGFTHDKPMELFDSHIGINDVINLQFYIVSPDAQKFLIARLVDRPSPPLTVLLNWKGKGLDSRK